MRSKDEDAVRCRFSFIHEVIHTHIFTPTVHIVVCNKFLLFSLIVYKPARPSTHNIRDRHTVPTRTHAYAYMHARCKSSVFFRNRTKKNQHVHKARTRKHTQVTFQQAPSITITLTGKACACVNHGTRRRETLKKNFLSRSKQ